MFLWMRGVKCSFVCGESYLPKKSWEGGSRKGNRTAKEVHPAALLKVEDLAVKYQMDDIDDEDKSSEELDNHIEWVEDKDYTIIYFAASEGKKL